MPDYTARRFTHLLSVNTPLVGLDHDEFFARNVQPRALNLLHTVLARVLESVDHFRHLLGRDGEAGARRPYAVAFTIEDGRLVDVASADEAGSRERIVSSGVRRWEQARRARPTYL